MILEYILKFLHIQPHSQVRPKRLARANMDMESLPLPYPVKEKEYTILCIYELLLSQIKIESTYLETQSIIISQFSRITVTKIHAIQYNKPHKLHATLLPPTHYLRTISN